MKALGKKYRELERASTAVIWSELINVIDQYLSGCQSSAFETFYELFLNNVDSLRTDTIENESCLYRMRLGKNGYEELPLTRKTDNVSNGTEMFKDCSNLKGAESYNSSQITHTMANYKTGYFKTYYQLGDTKTELCGEALAVESLYLSGDKDFVAHAPFTANTVSYARDLSTSADNKGFIRRCFLYMVHSPTSNGLRSHFGSDTEEISV